MSKALEMLNALRRFPTDDCVKWGNDEWAKETVRAEGWTVRTRFDGQLDVYHHFDYLDWFSYTIQAIGTTDMVEVLKKKVEAVKEMYQKYLDEALDFFYNRVFDVIMNISATDIFDVEQEQNNELLIEFYDEETGNTSTWLCSRNTCFECVKNFVNGAILC